MVQRERNKMNTGISSGPYDILKKLWYINSNV